MNLFDVSMRRAVRGNSPRRKLRFQPAMQVPGCEALEERLVLATSPIVGAMQVFELHTAPTTAAAFPDFKVTNYTLENNSQTICVTVQNLTTSSIVVSGFSSSNSQAALTAPLPQSD